ncbi:MAG: Na/Pi cotransporter family protein [bacterium]
MKTAPPLRNKSQIVRTLLASLSGMVLWILLYPAIANTEVAVGDLDQFQMGMGMFGGLALFLFGMDQMGEGLKAVAGDRMKKILRKLTQTRVHAAITGAIVTAVIQSSSVTTVLVVGFVSAGLMSLTQSVGIIMGANVGTTVTAQIVAFKVEEAALLMIAAGFAMMFLVKNDVFKNYGGILMGLGLVFFGMGIMSDSMAPLRSYEPFLELMEKMDRPVLAILIAAGFTALVQSSSATTGVVIVMASQGFVTLEAGIALALGANIGTCVTALLASMGKPVDAVRAAIVHILFNVLGVMLWLFLIPELASITMKLSPIYPELSGAERLAAEAPRQIANANTLFNVVNTMVFLVFAGGFAKIATMLVKDRPIDERTLIQAQYLDEEILSTPSLALERVRMELGRLGDIVMEMLLSVPGAVRGRSIKALAEIAQMDDRVDLLESAIVRYLGKIHQGSLSESESTVYLNLMNSTSNMESIGDIIETDITRIAHRMIEQEVRVSETMWVMLTELGQVVGEGLELTIEAVRDDNQSAAQEVVALKGEVDRRIAAALEHQAKKLSDEDASRIVIFRLEMELLEALKRIHTLSKRIARSVLPEEIAARVE